MDVSVIVDRDSFQRWLEALPQGSDAEREEAWRWAVVLAHRAAMRVLPGYWGWSLEEADLEKDVSAIPLLRNALIAGYAVATKAPEIWALDAAFSSSYMFSFDYLANVSHNAALGALDTGRRHVGGGRFAKASETVAVVGTAASVAWPSLRADAATLVAGKDPYLLPLWPAENPLTEQWSTIRTHPSTQSPGWRFWIDWYERALTGQPQDWKLLEKVALIKPTDWDKGEDHVNALIQTIVRNYRPPPPKLTPEIRAHLDLVLTIRDPSRQSAQYLKGQFEALEQAYRQTVGCPNETPEELEPIATLGRAFGQIAWLLGNETDKDRLIAQLQAEIAILKANNAALIAAASGPRASLMRDVFVATLGSAAGGIAATLILANVALVGGPATADSLEPLSKLLSGPVIDLSPSIPR